MMMAVVLKRKGAVIVEIETKYGKVSGKKITTPKGKVYIYPEYESMKELAERENVPLKELYKY